MFFKYLRESGYKRWIFGAILVVVLSVGPALTGNMYNASGVLGKGDLQGIGILLACFSVLVFGTIALVTVVIKAVRTRNEQVLAMELERMNKGKKAPPKKPAPAPAKPRGIPVDD
ncbi:MAG: hypothetical protein GXX99_02060 [Clostridiales bacterium]|nr:hypothetical protein [Clostridiales bacterium]